ncbi:MAG: hypothetical protein PWQ55_2852 [Chloroflexota bacterium]|nr:hypothetical protein [Chloroflexota bacterium]
MALLDEIKAFAAGIPAEFKEKKGLCELTFVVAERKAFLSKEKLTYTAKFRVDDAGKQVKFTEMLKESSSGMSNSGASFSTQSFKTGKGGRSESVIEQQANQFGKKYDYQFDFKSVREKIEALAQAAGYEFLYQITAKGL